MPAISPACCGEERSGEGSISAFCARRAEKMAAAQLSTAFLSFPEYPLHSEEYPHFCSCRAASESILRQSGSLGRTSSESISVLPSSPLHQSSGRQVISLESEQTSSFPDKTLTVTVQEEGSCVSAKNFGFKISGTAISTPLAAGISSNSTLLGRMSGVLPEKFTVSASTGVPPPLFSLRREKRGRRQ